VKVGGAACHAADMRFPWLIPPIQERAPAVLSAVTVN
jgi:hypothetical protein